MPLLESLQAQEILDSRGRPTILATCTLDTGAVASASVPSGASTGSAEALELRDGDPKRYRGLGCLRAVAHISGEIRDSLAGKRFESQWELDRTLIELDATRDKSRLGANAILAVSIAFAKASAISSGQPLYQQLGQLLALEPSSFPRLTINLFSGGMHAGGQVSIQDVLIVPLETRTIDETLVVAHDIYEAAADLIQRRYGMRRLRADEGGLAPPARCSREMIELALEAVAAAGYSAGHDVALGLDVAATHFYREGVYTLDEETLDAPEMIDRLARWIEEYSICSLEDGLAEEDWTHWPLLRRRIEGRALIVGDDLLCTNPSRIKTAIDHRACNTLLLKVNQIGTPSEAAQACQLARSAGWSVVVSVRSGETEDTWAADLAVGWRAEHFKNGSITQSERTAKYNRLLDMERQTGWPVRPWRTSSIPTSYA